MNKKNNKKFPEFLSLNNIALYTTIIAVLGLGVFATARCFERKKARHEIARLKGEIYKNRDARFTYLAKASEFAENKKMKQTVDSLRSCNDEMFTNVQQKYFKRIDRRYPLGCFFDAGQIATLNKIVTPYVTDSLKSDAELYTFIQKYMPLTPGTTIPTFENIVRILDIPDISFEPLGMVMDGGYVYMFQNPTRQKMFESYVADIGNAFSKIDENEPNFKVREIAPIKAEYMRNKHEIAQLNAKIGKNNCIIAKTLAEFDTRQDSLDVLFMKNREKLK